uniref:Uncharacterized protein n=1 Tax=Aegilops tauschii subsp. strangulata TaxID=200361 RepID=A0A453GK68_AEGTS
MNRPEPTVWHPLNLEPTMASLLYDNHCFCGLPISHKKDVYHALVVFLITELDA